VTEEPFFVTISIPPRRQPTDVFWESAEERNARFLLL
jgi:hypothetical protein